MAIDNALTEQEAFGIQALVQCMHSILPMEHNSKAYRKNYKSKEYHKKFYKRKNFGLQPQDRHDPRYGYDSGNTVTYVHGLLQIYLPGIASTLYRMIDMAYQKAVWDQYRDDNDELVFPPPYSCGIRTAEFLEYNSTEYLGLHKDGGSSLTISIALSEPDAYEGGYFHLSSGEAKFKGPRLSALVFPSLADHAVSQVTQGHRQVFVTELWVEEDAPLGLPRPTLDTFMRYKQRALENNK